MLKRIIFSICLLAGSGCAGFSPTGGPPALPALVSEAHDPLALSGVFTVLVMPVTFAPAARDAVTNADLINTELSRIASEQLDMQVVSGKEQLAGMGIAEGTENFPEIQKSGARNQVDGVLLTTVQTFVQRNGSRVATDTPAAFSFVMSLRRMSDGQELWKASYYQRDQALSENLLNLKSKLEDGAAWQDVQTIVKDGFGVALGDFATRRLSQFSEEIIAKKRYGSSGQFNPEAKGSAAQEGRA